MPSGRAVATLNGRDHYLGKYGPSLPKLPKRSLSPNGKRALFEYRGELFTVPKENGDWRNLTESSGTADRNPIWSPDGQKIAWFSDKSGEYQLMISDQKGMETAKAFDLPGPTFYFRPDWSPEGHAVISVLAHFAAYHQAGGWTNERKEALGESVTKTLSACIPNFS